MVNLSKESKSNEPSESDEFSCGCEGANWDPKAEVDRLLGESDEEESNLKKIAQIAHKCLQAMSLNDACEFMTEHRFPMTEENVKNFYL